MTRLLSIVIPCYNEAPTIRALLRRVEEADFGSWRKEILVVDDGSKDGTREILRDYTGRSNYRVIYREQNGGKGEAERDGIAHASGDYIVLQDADLEYDPSEIKKLLEVVDATGAPIVFGSRNMQRGWYRKGYFLTSFGVWVSTVLINILYGLRLTDAWTCYKLFSREVAKRARFIGNGFEADYLFIAEAAAHSFPIVEVPITHTPRSVEEGKKIRYRDGLRSMRLLLLHRLSFISRAKRGGPR